MSLALNLPGPAALQRSQQFGAQCLKIEPPSSLGGDPMQLYCQGAYLALHRGIRTQTLDLKTTAGQTQLARALEKADVLLTSQRPSALKRLGLDWRALHKAYPKLSQVAITGGEGEAAEVAGHDLTYLASQGLVAGLELPATLYADMAGSLQASEAILAAILQRTLTGKPSYCSVPLSHAAEHLALPRVWGLTLAGGMVGGAHAGYFVYACKDGRAVVAALEPHFANRLLQAAGLATELSKTDPNRMLEPATKAALKRWFAKQTVQSLRQLAQDKDLPIHALH